MLGAESQGCWWSSAWRSIRENSFGTPAMTAGPGMEDLTSCWENWRCRASFNLGRMVVIFTGCLEQGGGRWGLMCRGVLLVAPVCCHAADFHRQPHTPAFLYASARTRSPSFGLENGNSGTIFFYSFLITVALLHVKQTHLNVKSSLTNRTVSGRRRHWVHIFFTNLSYSIMCGGGNFGGKFCVYNCLFFSVYVILVFIL